MLDEKSLLNAILLRASELGARLFRQNVGTGWTGRVVRGPGAVTLGPNDVVLRDARPLHAGLCKGSSDLIGWVPVTITPDVVGETYAVFVALEVKTGSVRTTPEQLAFIQAVDNAGGIGVVARSVEEAVDKIERWK